MIRFAAKRPLGRTGFGTDKSTLYKYIQSVSLLFFIKDRLMSFPESNFISRFSKLLSDGAYNTCVQQIVTASVSKSLIKEIIITHYILVEVV